MSKKIKVGVLMGGPSAERKISLITGKAVCNNLNKDKYEVIPIEMNKRGLMYIDNNFFLKLNSSEKIQKKTIKKNVIPYNVLQKNPKINPDIIFIAMHGSYGEDGCMQGMLESLGIKYTGSGVLASALGMNKAKSAEIYQQHGLTIPNFYDFTIKDWKKDKNKIIKKITSKIEFPLVIKPVDQGSSVGTYLVKSIKDLSDKINRSFIYTQWTMVQKFIKGQEATCGVLEKQGQPFATPVTKIIANSGEFYDLKSKYGKGGSTHICPADFDKKTTKAIQEIALKTHKILGCRGMSRTDIFVGDDKKLYVIETNTIPGMTPTSLLPESASKMGIDFPDMLDLIIKAGLK